MKWVQKTAALFLLPVMLISFTGAELHFHKCGHTGIFYTDIRFTETDTHKNHVNCCTTDHIESCCAESCNKELNHDTCCTDLTREINTDKEYNFSNHSFKTEIHVLVLSEHYKLTETQLSDQKEVYADNIPFYISPPHSSKTQLLL